MAQYLLHQPILLEIPNGLQLCQFLLVSYKFVRVLQVVLSEEMSVMSIDTQTESCFPGDNC